AIDRVREIRERARDPVQNHRPQVGDVPDGRVVDDRLVVVVDEWVVERVQVEKTADERGETARERTPQPNFTSYGRVDWNHRAHEAVGLNDKSVGRRLQACDPFVGRRRAALEMRSLRILHVTPYFTDAW